MVTITRPTRAALVAGAALFLLWTVVLPLLPHSFFSYATRPLWDHSEASFLSLTLALASR